MGDCQPFAIMRLTHESIRSGLNDINKLLDQNGSASINELHSIYQDVKRVIQLHAKQEDDIFYVELGKKTSGITEAFTSEHEMEKGMFEKIDDFFQRVKNGSADSQLKEILKEWVTDHEKHLVHEEKLLMNILPEVFTYVESVNVVKTIIEYDMEEFENFHLSWVYSRLNSKQKEMYLGMLKGCSPKGKFKDFHNIVLDAI